jgi:hypothetical protein
MGSIAGGDGSKEGFGRWKLGFTIVNMGGRQREVPGASTFQEAGRIAVQETHQFVGYDLLT